jgi:2-methylcitrate dehydratase
MRIGRRAFIGGATTALATGVIGAKAGAAAPGGSASKGASSRPFAETRGGRSVEPAVETERLAAHVINTKFGDIPEEALNAAKLRALDLIGCAIGGVGAPGNAELVDVIRTEAGPGQASIIGTPWKVSASQAALVNATFARSFDFEVMTVHVDGNYFGSHNAPTTSMTTLALSEALGVTGKDYISALVIGDDFAARTLAGSGLDYALGWDGAAVYAPLAATAIASRLLGLTPQQTKDALGLTVNTIASTNQHDWDGSTDWKFQQGPAARNAILSAQLAKRGWVGIGDPLTAPYGFYAQYTSGLKNRDLLLNDLGKKFYAEEYFKPYPACGGLHVCIEAALDLRAKHKLTPADIEKVSVRVPEFSLTSALCKPYVVTRYPFAEAIFSIQFHVANALLQGSMRQEHYDDSYLRSRELHDMVAKVSMGPLPEGREPGEVEVEVITRQGKKFIQQHDGTPSKHPVHHKSTWDEIVAKFRQQVEFSRFVTKSDADEIIQRVRNIEKETNMAEFVKLLTKNHYRA